MSIAATLPNTHARIDDAAAPSRTRAVAWMLIAALVVRLSFTLGVFQFAQATTGLARGSDKYEFIAKTLVKGGGYRFSPELGESMFLPPVYPLFLATLFYFAPSELHLQAAQIAQSVLDSLTCVLIYLIAAPRLGHRAALVGAWLYALYPGAWVSCSRYLTEPLFAFLTVLFVHLFARFLDSGRKGDLVGASLVCALNVLCKSAAGMLPVALLAAALMLPLWRGCRRRAIVGAIVCAAMTGVGVAPWVYRNYVVSGTYVYPTTSGGLALYTAWVYAANPKQEIRKSVDQAAAEVRALGEANGIRLDPRDKYPRWFYSAQDEVKLDQLARAAAWERISADRSSFAAHVLGNLWRFWIGAPTTISLIVAVATNVPLLVLALIGLIRTRFWEHGAIATWLMVSLYLFASHVAILAVVRYSMTVMPLVCALAGVSVAAWFAREKRQPTQAAVVRRSVAGDDR